MNVFYYSKIILILNNFTYANMFKKGMNSFFPQATNK